MLVIYKSNSVRSIYNVEEKRLAILKGAIIRAEPPDSVDCIELETEKAALSLVFDPGNPRAIYILNPSHYMANQWGEIHVSDGR